MKIVSITESGKRNKAVTLLTDDGKRSGWDGVFLSDHASGGGRRLRMAYGRLAYRMAAARGHGRGA